MSATQPGLPATHSGGCACGAVRFEADGAPRFVANCHCASCRRATGAAFAPWAGFPDAAVRWTSAARTTYASSPGVERSFCARCGSPLSYRSERWPDETHLLLGAFDAPETFAPTADVFTEEALAWARPEPRQS